MVETLETVTRKCPNPNNECDAEYPLNKEDISMRYWCGKCEIGIRVEKSLELTVITDDEGNPKFRPNDLPNLNQFDLADVGRQY